MASFARKRKDQWKGDLLSAGFLYRVMREFVLNLHEIKAIFQRSEVENDLCRDV